MGVPKREFAGIKLLIFDLDGTLIDSKRDLVLSVNAARAQLGLPPLPDELIAAYVGEGVPTLIRRALGYERAEPVNAQTVEQGVKLFLEHYRMHLLDNTLTYAGVREALDALRSRTLAVLTNKPVDFSRAILAGLGIAGRFAFVYGGDSFPRKKPDPVGVVHLCSEANTAPRQAMIIGDTGTDILAGRNGGVWTCGVTYGFRPETLEAAEPDVFVDDLRELACLLAGQLRELPRLI